MISLVIELFEIYIQIVTTQVPRFLNYEKRERREKGWSRSKKEALIQARNPKWTDLAVTISGLGKAPSTRWQERRGWYPGDPSTSSG